MPSVTEKVVIFVADNVLGDPIVVANQYPALDYIAKRGQSGYLSTFEDCDDIIEEVTGINYHGAGKLGDVLGPMKLSVLVSKSKYSGFGDVENIEKMKEKDEIYAEIQDKLKAFNVVIVEMMDLKTINNVVNMMKDDIDGKNVAICLILGYKENSEIPKFRLPPECVDPSYKIVGPNVLDNLNLKKPCIFISASMRLTRIDNVQSFDENDIYQNNCMGILPICQILREFSYYTGSSWKYGA